MHALASFSAEPHHGSVFLEDFFGDHAVHSLGAVAASIGTLKEAWQSRSGGDGFKSSLSRIGRLGLRLGSEQACQGQTKAWQQAATVQLIRRSQDAGLR